MESTKLNKRKIFNDPVYGFVNIKHEIIFDLIEHPYFQRLRRILQLGLTNLVYPGTNHTRFQHALGATHLMESALTILKSKGYIITDEESEAVTIAILLHDIGHGPFSHALENTLIKNVSHEDLSLLLMEELNKETNGKLSLAIEIFKGDYKKNFLHQLVASQLDMDRLDYLNRDSFFSGVLEGMIGSDRIIKMLDVVNDELVVEEKGIYSIEKFLIARRLMYWQVYLHKTAISAEKILIKLLERAKYLALKKVDLFATPALKFFLYNSIKKEDFVCKQENNRKTEAVGHFVNLDDNDIFASAKEWINHPDFILSKLAYNLINRKLYKIEMQEKPFLSEKIEKLKKMVVKKYKIDMEDCNYFVFEGSVVSNFYNSSNNDHIKIKLKNGKIFDITDVSEIQYLSALSADAEKNFLCYPKEFYEY